MYRYTYKAKSIALETEGINIKINDSTFDKPRQ